MTSSKRSAEKWVEATVNEHARGSLVVAGTYVLIAFAGLVFWFGFTFGLMFMFSLVLMVIGLGISVYYVFVVWALQLLLYPIVRRKDGGQWEIARDVDGNVYVVKPENDLGSPAAGSEGDSAFTNRGVFAGLFFAVPLALDESWRQLVRAARIRKIEREPLVKVVEVLITEQRKVTFEELNQQMSSDNLVRALDAASHLPGFQFFAGEPQGVTLIGNAIEEALTTG